VRALTLLLTLSTAHAQVGGLPCEEAIPMTVPCAGILLPEVDTYEGFECLEVTIPEMKAQTEHRDLLHAVEVKELADSIFACEDARAKTKALLKKALGTVPVPPKEPWYRATWVEVTVVVGAFVLGGVAVHYIKKAD